jgi:hypothetical protein
MRKALFVGLILVVFLLGFLSASFMFSGPSLNIPLVPRPTATQRAYNAPRSTITPNFSCTQDLRRQCDELAELFTEALNEIGPLCRVKSEEWCVEQYVSLGRRARGVGTSSCGRAARDALAGAFRDLAMARSMSTDSDRDKMIQQAFDSLGRFNEACK